MATVKPFRAVRPKKGMEEAIAALPYDVYNRSEAKTVVSKNPLSFLKIDRAETSFGEDVDTYDERVYKKARELYEDMLVKGEFVKDENAGFFLYEQTMLGRTQTGLVAVASVDEYLNGVIKKHENTLASKETDRIKHVDTVNAQTGPIFLSYRNNDELKNLFAKIKTENGPYCDFVSEDGIRHRAWEVFDEDDVAKISEGFKRVENLYIADGHHRCASAAKVSVKRRESCAGVDETAEYNYFLSIIFPDEDLMIMDYNRLVKDLNGLSFEEILTKIGCYFDIKEIELNNDKPDAKGNIYMLFENRKYCISLKPEFISEDPIESLDVSVLQKYVLSPLFGITDPKTDKRIDFVGGIRGVEELRRRLTVDSKVAFAMYPTLMSELFAVADADMLMPPKSTWFEPKLRSGLFIHEL